MRACQEGAGKERSFGVNIRLPFEQEPNEIISKDPKLSTFRYFFTRKLMFIKEADAAALFPGGFGTHDEGYECLTLVQTGKTKPMPIVFVDAPRGTYWKTWKRYVEEHLLRRGLISPEDMSLFRVTSSVDEAIAEINGFYRVYHSARTVGRDLVIRLTRAGTREAVHQDYIRFARAKGLSERRVIGVHLLKNILIPVVTVLGLEFGNLVAFSVVTETIFAWPGMGKLLIASIQSLDRPIIVAYLVVIVLMFVVINLVVDILYSVLDPRVRLGEAGA